MSGNSGGQTDSPFKQRETPLARDGRNINSAIGIMTGEASGQIARRTSYEETPLQSKSYPYIPSQQPGATPAYYDHPMLKAPVWIWSIPVYFYVGGATGIATTFGAAAQLFAPESMKSLVVRSHWIGTVGGALSAALLIHDLGRPSRFLNMLRVLRISSPMSVGSWILTIFSSAAGAAAVLPFGPKLLRPLVQVLGPVAGLFGLGLAGYTGVLLSQTAVPVWQQAYKLTPTLFLASGAAAGASLLELFPLNATEHRSVERFGLLGKLAELVVTVAVEREVSRVPRVGRPLQEGYSGFLWQAAKVLTVASALISLAPGKSRAKRTVSGIIGSLASLSLRCGIFYAGRKSSRDPRASFEQQRQLH